MSESEANKYEYLTIPSSGSHIHIDCDKRGCFYCRAMNDPKYIKKSPYPITKYITNLKIK